MILFEQGKLKKLNREFEDEEQVLWIEVVCERAKAVAVPSPF